MGNISTWVAVASTAVAVALLMDDLRLRAELAELKMDSSASVSPQKTGPKRGSITRAATNARLKPEAAKWARPDATDPLEDPEVEARIQEAVADRVAEQRNAETPTGLEAMVEERIEERMEERRNERRTRHREAMTEHIKEFSAEADHSEDVQEQMLNIMDNAMGSAMEIRQAIQDGELERSDAYPEFMSLREEVDSSLVELLGAEDAEEFLENVPGPMGQR